jgi:hypothetical protein
MSMMWEYDIQSAKITAELDALRAQVLEMLRMFFDDPDAGAEMRRVLDDVKTGTEGKTTAAYKLAFAAGRTVNLLEREQEAGRLVWEYRLQAYPNRDILESWSSEANERAETVLSSLHAMRVTLLEDPDTGEDV